MALGILKSIQIGGAALALGLVLGGAGGWKLGVADCAKATAKALDKALVEQKRIDTEQDLVLSKAHAESIAQLRRRLKLAQDAQVFAVSAGGRRACLDAQDDGAIKFKVAVAPR